MQTLLLDGDDVDDLGRLAEVIAAVEQAFAAYERGDALMPAKSYIDLPRYNGDFRSMPSYLDAGEWDVVGFLFTIGTSMFLAGYWRLEGSIDLTSS